jgi:spoIIIJ-associated protein
MPMTADRVYEAKNLSKAIEKAAEALNIRPDDLDYDVISPGSSGIFGLAGVKKAKIRVNLPEEPLDAASLVDRLDQEISGRTQPPSDNDAAQPEQAPAAVDHDQLDGPKALGHHILKRIVDTISDDAHIKTEDRSSGLFFSVNGSDAALLIGKRGQTLEAIQSLVEKIVNKHNSHNGKIRVQVDVEGYLQTRQENLEKLAQKLASKSKRIGKPIALRQMSAYERRVIHLALKKDPGVRTKSKGEGYLRKLVIFPKKKASRPN